MLSPKERRVIADMAAGAHLHVYVERTDAHGNGRGWNPDWPRPGSGAVVGEAEPVPVTERLVRRLARFGLAWDATLKAEVLTPAGRLRARAALDGRDLLLVATEHLRGA